MNIGIVSTWFERGAAYVSRQYKKILEKDNNVFVFARGGEKYARNDPKWSIKKVYWSRRKYFHLFSDIDLREFKKWLRKNDIEIVLFNEQRSWAPVVLCKKMNIKTVCYIDYYKDDQIQYFDMFDALLCNTKRHYSVFSWHDNSNYIPWGTDIEVFNPPQDFEKPVEDGYVTFFHSAGMNPYRKGTDLLLLAFNKLTNANAKLVIHSQVDLSKSIPELSSICEFLHDQGRLEIITKTVGAPGLYHKGDVYVYPTRLEGIGLSLLEAMACGLPPIVPDCAPMNEFVPRDYDWGKVVSIEKYVSRWDGYYWPQCIVKINELSKSMVWYCEHSNLLPTFKSLAKEYVEKERNWLKNADNLNDIFRSCEFRNVSQEIIKKSFRHHFLQVLRDIIDPQLLTRSINRLPNGLRKIL